MHGAQMRSRQIAKTRFFLGYDIGAISYDIVSSGLVQARRCPIRLLEMPMEYGGEPPLLSRDVAAHVSISACSRLVTVRIIVMRSDSSLS